MGLEIVGIDTIPLRADLKYGSSGVICRRLLYILSRVIPFCSSSFVVRGFDLVLTSSMHSPRPQTHNQDN